MESRVTAASGYAPGLLHTSSKIVSQQSLKVENKVAIMLNHAKQMRSVQRLAVGLVDCAMLAGELGPGPRRTDLTASILQGQLTCHGSMDAY